MCVFLPHIKTKSLEIACSFPLETRLYWSIIYSSFLLQILFLKQKVLCSFPCRISLPITVNLGGNRGTLKMQLVKGGTLKGTLKMNSSPKS